MLRTQGNLACVTYSSFKYCCEGRSAHAWSTSNAMDCTEFPQRVRPDQGSAVRKRICTVEDVQPDLCPRVEKQSHPHVLESWSCKQTALLILHVTDAYADCTFQFGKESMHESIAARFLAPLEPFMRPGCSCITRHKSRSV